MLKLFAVLIYVAASLCNVTTMVQTSVETYAAANKACILLLKAHFPLRFDRLVGEIVADRTLRS